MLCDKNLAITAWNVRGIQSAIPYLRELLAESKIVCISEHWLFENNLCILDQISEDFNVVSAASKFSSPDVFGRGRGQGGVALFWRCDLPGVTPISDLVHDRVCGIRFQTPKGMVLNILAIYLPARGSDEDLGTTLDEIAEIIDSRDPGSLTLLCGDFNADIGCLGNKRSRKKPDQRGRMVYDFINEYALWMTNMGPKTEGPVNTFKCMKGSSTIDYIAIPVCMRDMVTHSCVLKDEIMNLSDHNPVSVSLNLEDLVSATAPAKKDGKILWKKLSKADLFDKYTYIPVRWTYNVYWINMVIMLAHVTTLMMLLKISRNLLIDMLL